MVCSQLQDCVFVEVYQRVRCASACRAFDHGTELAGEFAVDLCATAPGPHRSYPFNVAEVEGLAFVGINIRLIQAEVVEELVTVPDPCHIEVRSCVEATAMIIDSLGIRSIAHVISLSEVERARFLAIPLVPVVRQVFAIQVYASRPAISAACSLLFLSTKPGMLPRA